MAGFHIEFVYGSCSDVNEFENELEALLTKHCGTNWQYRMNTDSCEEEENEYDNLQEYDMIVLSIGGDVEGKAVLDEEAECKDESCNGSQYTVYWEDGEVTQVCGKGLTWIDEKTAQIM